MARGKQSARKESPRIPRGVWWGIGLLLVVGAGLGAGSVHGRARQILARAPVGVAVDWPVAPGQKETWLAPTFRERITGDIEALLAGRPLDHAALARVGAALERGGWFVSRPSVRRDGDGVVRVLGEWRTPTCVIRHEGRDYASDWTGRLLPVVYVEGVTSMRFVEGVSSGPATDAHGEIDYAQPWPGDDVQAGLTLLRPLCRESFAPQVRGVNVGQFYRLSRMSIVTDRGTEVVWGGRYEEFIPGEASTEEKLARLRHLASRTDVAGRIDAGLERLELFDEHGLVIDLTRRP